MSKKFDPKLVFLVVSLIFSILILFDTGFPISLLILGSGFLGKQIWRRSFYIHLLHLVFYIGLLYLIFIWDNSLFNVRTNSSSIVAIMWPIMILVPGIRHRSYWIASCIGFVGFVYFSPQGHRLLDKIEFKSNLESAIPTIGTRVITESKCDGFEVVQVFGLKRCPNDKSEYEYYIENNLLNRVVIETDDSGFRKVPEFPVNPSLNESVLVLGGSKAFGLGVSDDETVTYYLGKKLHLSTTFGAMDNWGPGQWAWLVNNQKSRKEQKKIVVLISEASDINKASGEYFETFKQHPTYPKYAFSQGKLKYLGGLSYYSFAKFFYYPVLYRICKFQCKFLSGVGSSKKDYLEHLKFIATKAKEKWQSELYFVIHPGRDGEELMRRLSKEDLIQAGWKVIDARKLFPMKAPYVIDEVQDNYLTAQESQALAEFIAEHLEKP